ncbi:MAG: Mannosylglycerate hydrolase [Lentisphaerae bacterium ADurb.Bin242]|nr:MAG: Mannosylglycerate hydrolase [Lentisphaerae bacterium ADurb.Bin242]
MNETDTIHVICQAHLDLAWLWRWRESWSEALNNVTTVVRLMEKYPQLTFSYSNAVIYQWVKESAPGLFREIQTLVRQGRWEVVGGWWVEADCNLPSGESLVRQALYGKRFIRDHFDRDVKIGYCPDAFGHCAELPRILKSTGYDYYVFSKPRLNEDFPHLFRWCASDGSEIVTWRMYGGYATGPNDTRQSLEVLIRQSAKNNFAADCRHTALFIGLGDHGGGPGEEQIRKVIELSDCRDLPVIKFSTLDGFFAELHKDGVLSVLPRFRGELVPHNIGCYSACGRIKELNRRTEIAMREAETLAVLSEQLGYVEYPGEKLEEAWKNLLFNQFHDIIAGTCIAACYDEAEEALGASLHAARTIVAENLHRISYAVNTSKLKNNAIFIFNPLPWPRESIVALDMFTAIDGAGGPAINSVMDCSSGERMPVQFAPADSPYGPWLKPWEKLLVKTVLPPYGYTLLELSSEKMPPPEPLPHSPVWDRCAFLKPPGLIVGSDNSDVFAHGLDSFRTEWKPVVFENEFVLERGPVRFRTRRCGVFEKSELNLEMITLPGSDLTELSIYGQWRETDQLLKFELPVAMSHLRAVYQTPYGHIVRPMDRQEVSGHGWCALNGDYEGEPCTVGLINSGVYSFDTTDSSIRLTLRRSVEGPSYHAFRYSLEEGKKYLDQGAFALRILVVVMRAPFDSVRLDKLTMEFQHPAHALMETMHPGSLPDHVSFFEVESSGSIFCAWKKAENQLGFILRLQESSGMPGTARIFSAVFKIDEVIELSAFALQTIRIAPHSGKWRFWKVNGLEE